MQLSQKLQDCGLMTQTARNITLVRNREVTFLDVLLQQYTKKDIFVLIKVFVVSISTIPISVAFAKVR